MFIYSVDDEGIWGWIRKYERQVLRGNILFFSALLHVGGLVTGVCHIVFAGSSKASLARSTMQADDEVLVL